MVLFSQCKALSKKSFHLYSFLIDPWGKIKSATKQFSSRKWTKALSRLNAFFQYAAKLTDVSEQTYCH